MCHDNHLQRGVRAIALGGCVGLATVTTLSAAVDAHAQDTAAVVPPVVLSRVDAVYPAVPQGGARSADVVLLVTIDALGHVVKAEAVESGGPEFEGAAIAAMREWTFVPAKRQGTAVASRIKVPFHFAAPEPSLAPAPTSTSASTSTSAREAAPPTAAAAAHAPAAAPAGAQVEQVDVRGRLTARSHGASDYDVTLGELKAIPRTNASDVLTLAPGFLLTNEGGAGHAEQVFLRGFDAHEGQDLEFTVDGVPINDAGNYHGNGYADTHFIIPELIESVRVLEGPYAPQQGNFAVAGSADYHLGLDRRGLTSEYTAGNFGTQRLLLLWGPSDAGNGTFGGAEYFTTDGFGAGRQAKRGTAMGQVEIPLSKGTLRLTAGAYLSEFNSAGVVREDDYASGKVGFYGTEDPNQTGNDASRVSVAATYEARFRDMDVSQQIFLIDRTMRLRENWTGFLLDVQEPTQEPHDQRGDLIDFHYDALTAGARGFARWHGTALGLRQEFEGGYFARFDQTTSTQDRVAAGSNTPYAVDADLTSTLGDVGVYIDGDVRLLPWLALRGGVRADMFLYDVLDDCDVQSVDNPSKALAASQIDVSCLSQLEHGVYREPFLRSTTGDGAVMPRGTLVIGPIDHFAIAASAGDGIRSVDPSYVSQGLATPFITAQSRDLGVSYAGSLGSGAGTTGLTARSVFFQTHVGEDLIFDPTEGRNTLAGGSTRTGWSGSTRVLGPFFDLAANATLVKAVFDATGDCAPSCGLLVPYVPDLVLRGNLAVFGDLPWHVAGEHVRATAGYGVSYVGRRPLPYGDVSDVIFLSDASVGLAWTIWHVRLSGQNIFDSKYRLGEYNYASDFQKLLPAPTLAPERSFTAGAPRTVFLSVSATLGGPS